MSVGTVLSWWIDGLAGAGQPVAWASLVLVEPTGLTITTRARSGDRPRTIATVPLARDDVSAAQITERLRTLSQPVPGPVAIRFGIDEMIKSDIALPQGVRGSLDQVVPLKIEEVSPLSADRMVFAWRLRAPQPGTTDLLIDAWITRRARYDAVLNACEQRFGSLVSVDIGTSADTPALAAFRTRLDTDSRRKRAKAWLAVSLSLATLAIGSATAWSVIEGRNASALEQRLQEMTSRDAGAQDARNAAAEAGLAHRKQAPVAVIALEAISRLLPDDASLDRFEMSGQTLTLTGRTADAPALLALLDVSPHVESAEFAAPTTRLPDTNLSLFSIRLALRPQMTIGPPRPPQSPASSPQAPSPSGTPPGPGRPPQ